MMSERGFTPEEAKRSSGKRKKSEAPKEAPKQEEQAEELTDADIIETSDASPDDDVVTSAPTMEKLNLKSDKMRRERMEESVRQASEYAARPDREGAPEMSAEEKAAADRKASDDALNRLEVASIHRDSEDFQREQQEAKEKAELYTETVGAAGSIEAIKNVVDMIGSMETESGKKISAKELKGWIDSAMHFPNSSALEKIPDGYGLREKVAQLANKEKRMKDREARVDETMREHEELKAVDAGWDEIAAEQQHADELEANFMRRGEVIDKLHGAKQPTEKNTFAEGMGEVEAQKYEKAMKAAEAMPVIEQQLERAKKALGDRGVTNLEDAYNRRTIDGAFGKVKGFFGGLFNKKTREVNSLMDTYASLLEDYNKAKADLDERKLHTDRSKEGLSIRAQNKQ